MQCENWTFRHKLKLMLKILKILTIMILLISLKQFYSSDSQNMFLAAKEQL